jgi:hypothetical protein
MKNSNLALRSQAPGATEIATKEETVSAPVKAQAQSHIKKVIPAKDAVRTGTQVGPSCRPTGD